MSRLKSREEKSLCDKWKRKLIKTGVIMISGLIVCISIYFLTINSVSLFLLFALMVAVPGVLFLIDLLIDLVLFEIRHVLFNWVEGGITCISKKRNK